MTAKFFVYLIMVDNLNLFTVVNKFEAVDYFLTKCFCLIHIKHIYKTIQYTVNLFETLGGCC